MIQERCPECGGYFIRSDISDADMVVMLPYLERQREKIHQVGCTRTRFLETSEIEYE